MTGGQLATFCCLAGLGFGNELAFHGLRFAPGRGLDRVPVADPSDAEVDGQPAGSISALTVGHASPPETRSLEA